MSAPHEAALYTPPRPIYSVEQPSLRQFLRATRTNPLLLWPEAAYERTVMENRLLGRTRLLINSPDAITGFSSRTPAITGERRQRFAFCGRSSATGWC